MIDGLKLVEGKRIVELTDSSVDKGFALLELKRELGADRVLFMGDDVTDETASPPSSLAISGCMSVSGLAWPVSPSPTLPRSPTSSSPSSPSGRTPELRISDSPTRKVRTSDHDREDWRPLLLTSGCVRSFLDHG